MVIIETSPSGNSKALCAGIRAHSLAKEASPDDPATRAVVKEGFCPGPGCSAEGPSATLAIHCWTPCGTPPAGPPPLYFEEWSSAKNN